MCSFLTFLTIDQTNESQNKNTEDAVKDDEAKTQDWLPQGRDRPVVIHRAIGA
jgi:hypothetical protein